MEIIKNTIKVGNSAGVLLPKEWLNMQVKIVLEPFYPEKEVLNILRKENLLKRALGVYIVGSYARKEQTFESDVDVLVITYDIDKKIFSGRYEILLVSKAQLEKQLKTNVLPILPMVIEAETIINEKLRKDYSNIKLTRKNLSYHIETTKTAMNMIKADIQLSEELKEKNISDNIAYSLILRLRTLYIIDCIRKKKIWRKKEFLELLKKISGSTRVYEGYLRAKSNKKSLRDLPLIEAQKLSDYISQKIKEIEKWVTGRKG